MNKLFLVIVFTLAYFSSFSQEKDTLVNVSSLEEFKESLLIKRKKVKVYIDGELKIDLSNEPTIELPEGITIESNRGRNGNLGVLFFSNNFSTNPMFICKGNNIKIKGIRFRGPDDKIKQVKKLYNEIQNLKENNAPNNKIHMVYVSSLPNSVGIKLYGKNIVIEDCEIYGWSRSGLYVEYSGNVKIANNFIHHNQRTGLGYGILVQGYAEIYNNIFDYNRHAIASSGKWRAGYHAHHNICLSHSTLQSHIFDVHGGKDRNDGTDIAGRLFLIHDNIFFINEQNIDEIFMIRGRPTKEARIFKNKIFVKKIKKFDYIVQIRGKGNFIEYDNEQIKF